MDLPTTLDKDAGVIKSGVANLSAGGPGTATFDQMAAIEQWVAKGRPPESIPASHRADGVIDRTLSLCPYGKVARWKRTGSTDDAANFACTPETGGCASR